MNERDNHKKQDDRTYKKTNRTQYASGIRTSLKASAITSETSPKCPEDEKKRIFEGAHRTSREGRTVKSYEEPNFGRNFTHNPPFAIA